MRGEALPSSLVSGLNSRVNRSVNLDPVNIWISFMKDVKLIVVCLCVCVCVCVCVCECVCVCVRAREPEEAIKADAFSFRRCPLHSMDLVSSR